MTVVTHTSQCPLDECPEAGRTHEHEVDRDGNFVPIVGAKTLTTRISQCARCGGDHAAIAFRPLTNPSDAAYAFWGTCPATGQPIMMAVKE